MPTEHPSPDALKTVDAFIHRHSPTYADSDKVDLRFKDFTKALAHLIGLDAASSDDPLKFIFDQRLDTGSQAIAAAAFVHLIADDPDALPSKSLEIEVNKLFDRVYETTLYDLDGLQVDAQTFEKTRVLRSHPAALQNDLDEIVASLTDLDSLDHVRQRLFKLVNSTRGRALVKPFLPSRLIEGPLQELLRAAVRLREADAESVVKEHDDCVRLLEEYSEALAQHTTWYVRTILAPLTEQLRSAVEEFYADSDATKPADVELTPSEKRYPLHERNLEGDLRVELRNVGSGPAIDLTIEVADAEGVTPQQLLTSIGHFTPGERTVQIPVLFNSSDGTGVARLLLEVTWRNAHGGRSSKDFVVEFHGQDQSIDWEQFTWQNPYDLEPVDNETDLVGRQESLARLYALARGRTAGNGIIHGQKRVGKTSIAKTLLTRLSEADDLDVISVYLEAGEFVAGSALETIRQLGTRIAESMKAQRAEIGHLSTPDCAATLAPLNDFLTAAKNVLPSTRTIIVLDEFDDIPLELYRRGELGNAFFLSLRSMSGRPEVGLILVGGQNMDYVLSCQGQALNKFLPIEVSYFDASRQWEDFAQLIRHPSSDILDFSLSALEEVFAETSGHPFFTKLICQSIFSRAVRRRDAHVTEREVRNSVVDAVSEVGSQHFQHFWEDGIFEEGAKREEVSVARRKVLLAFARATANSVSADLGKVHAEAKRFQVTETRVSRELDAFVHRRVFRNDRGQYSARFPFFHRWLREAGSNEIVTTFSDADGIRAVAEEEERLRVSAGELQQVSEGWRVYRGRQITTEDIRAWLDQFDTMREQRLMFQVLRGVDFFSEARSRSAMSAAYSRTVAKVVDDSDAADEYSFLLSYLGPVGKSSAHYMRVFADENRIFSGRLVDRAELTERINRSFERQVVVFVDDMLGTGNQAREFFNQLDHELGDAFRNDRAVGFYLPLAGDQKAGRSLEAFLKKIRLPIQLSICTPLGDEDRAFSPTRDLFADESERVEARAIAESYGARLVPDAPRGYGDCEFLIVFDQRCPNNSLPILWAEGGGWRPLFPRH